MAETRASAKDLGRTAAERLVELDELRTRGLITESEYEQKRANLVREL